MNWSILIPIAVPIVVIPVLGTVLFTKWLKRRRDLSAEMQVKCWDIFIKGIGAFTVIVAGAFAVVQYIHESKTETRRYNEQVEKDRERYDNIWERNIEKDQGYTAFLTRELNLKIYGSANRDTLFHELVDVVATLAAADSITDADAKIAWKRFERLYHGQLVFVEKDEVVKAMKVMRSILLEWRQTAARPEFPSESELNEAIGDHGFSKLKGIDRKDLDKVRFYTLVLAHACRKEIAS